MAQRILKIEGNIWYEGGLRNLSKQIFPAPNYFPPLYLSAHWDPGNDREAHVDWAMGVQSLFCIVWGELWRLCLPCSSLGGAVAEAIEFHVFHWKHDSSLGQLTIVPHHTPEGCTSTQIPNKFLTQRKSLSCVCVCVCMCWWTRDHWVQGCGLWVVVELGSRCIQPHFS